MSRRQLYPERGLLKQELTWVVALDEKQHQPYLSAAQNELLKAYLGLSALASIATHSSPILPARVLAAVGCHVHGSGFMTLYSKAGKIQQVRHVGRRCVSSVLECCSDPIYHDDPELKNYESISLSRADACLKLLRSGLPTNSALAIHDQLLQTPPAFGDLLCRVSEHFVGKNYARCCL